MFKRILSGFHVYSRRIGRWFHIIWCVRGKTLNDRAVIYKSWLNGFISSWKGLWSWQDPVLLDDAEVSVRNIGSFRLRGRTDDLWHVTPGREPEIHAFIGSFLRPGDTFIDAGANIGFYTIQGSQVVGPAGRVIAVEMIPSTAKRLKSHLDLNQCKNTVLIEAALSDEEGRVVDAHLPAEQCGQASLSRDFVDSETIQVRTTTLDSISADCKHVRLIKMDLEGAELQALRGAEKLLNKVNAICFEDRDRQSPVAAYLSEKGFSLTRLGAADVLAIRDDC